MKKVLLLIIILIILDLSAYLLVMAKHKPPVTAITKPRPIATSLPSVTLPLPKPKPPVEDLSGKQIIVFGFDGSKSLNMWQESLDFSQQMIAQNKPVYFTYFVSGVYLLTYENRLLYHPPKAPAGTSPIGFADNNDDLVKRINYINRAVAEGHEIGSHLNGHFDGTTWSSEDWQQEFSQFSQLYSNVNTNNNIPESQAKLNIDIHAITGFRAPDLGRNQYLWPILKSFGYDYDTSTVGTLGAWPTKEDGLWKFAIPQIKFANTNSRLLSMDYNFYIKQTKAKDILKAGTPDWEKAKDEVYQSYTNYFDNNYSTTKAPVFIAHHFSKWNDGVYWEALKQFAENKCGQVDVRCITFRTLADYLNVKP